MGVLYKLQTFEGPLDLLLHLIDKAEIDIYDIPISEITDQYMEYVSTMQELSLDVASEFLVMAATLMAIKSKMLLPKPPVIELDGEQYDPDYDPRAELVQMLLEYRKFKEAAEYLRDKELARSLIYTREPADLTPYANHAPANPVRGLHIADLVIALHKALKRAASRNRVAKIERDELSVNDRIVVLESLLKAQGKVKFSALLYDCVSREGIIVTFLALLELMRLKKVSCYQHRLFDDMIISYREGA
ncbi:MAG TPA: segregation/condensation protein A [Bacilli bacterium]